MFLLELATEALRNLARHKLRSFLTTLGIIFGVASVLSMVAIGEGARRAILDRIGELGIRNIIVNTKKPPEETDVMAADGEGDDNVIEYGLTLRDARMVTETVPFIEDVLSVHDVEKWVWFKSKRVAAKVRGVPAGYFTRLGLDDPFMGRILDETDDIEKRRVCVVRLGLLEEAKYLGDPLKLEIKVGNEYFQVIGVLRDDEFQSPNKSVLGLDDRSLEVYIPFSTVIDRFGYVHASDRSGSGEAARVELHQLVAAVTTEEKVAPVARAIRTLLESQHDKQDYEIIVPLELLASQQRTQRVFNIVLPIIAGISLLVGGIGILNIMLASITERTREIGIRRAIGATGADITWQFLIETVTLATIGGLLGVGLGIASVAVLAEITGWKAAITPWSLVLAMGVSCLTGVAFGIYPARRAAAMDPIRALRT